MSASTMPLMLKAALPAVPGLNLLPGVRRSGDTLPRMTLLRSGVRIDRDHVAAYAKVCGFPDEDTVPLTYPHLLAFGLHMAVMTDASFPFPAVGTVHLENSLTAHRTIRADERLDVVVRSDRLRAHPKGRVFDMLTEVRSGGDLLWEETSTFLRVGKGNDASATSGPPSSAHPDAPKPAGTQWRLAGDLGRRYAAVSGDHNPIHLYGLTAKAFGFPRQIAHGMWSKARCLAALDGRLPEAVTVDVAFKKPVLLPGSVAFGSGHEPDGSCAFALSNPSTGAPHLLGSARPA
jgi:hypothetical protein